MNASYITSQASGWTTTVNVNVHLLTLKSHIMYPSQHTPLQQCALTNSIEPRIPLQSQQSPAMLAFSIPSSQSETATTLFMFNILLLY